MDWRSHKGNHVFADSSSVGLLASTTSPICISSSFSSSIGAFSPGTNGVALGSALADRTARPVHRLDSEISFADSSIINSKFESASESIASTSSASVFFSFCVVRLRPSSFSFAPAFAIVDSDALAVVTVPVAATVSAVFGGILAFAKALSCRSRFCSSNFVCNIFGRSRFQIFSAFSFAPHSFPSSLQFPSFVLAPSQVSIVLSCVSILPSLRSILLR